MAQGMINSVACTIRRNHTLPTCLRHLPRRCCASSARSSPAARPLPLGIPSSCSRACTCRQLRLPTSGAILHGCRPQICKQKKQRHGGQDDAVRHASDTLLCMRACYTDQRNVRQQKDGPTSMPCCSSASSQALHGSPLVAAAGPASSSPSPSRPTTAGSAGTAGTEARPGL